MEQNIENKIIEVARQVFFERGYNGTSMRDIAQKADVNYALLHYYFKTKDKLFEIVFTDAFSLLFRQLGKALTSDISLFDKIRLMIAGYVHTAEKSPQLPGFVMNELTINAHKMMPILKKHKELNDVTCIFDTFYDEIEQSYKNGLIKNVNPKVLLSDILSMSLFPFIGKVCLTELIFEDKKSYNQMIKQHVEHVSDTLISSISV